MTRRKKTMKMMMERREHGELGTKRKISENAGEREKM